MTEKPILYNCRRGYANEVAVLLKGSINVNEEDELGQTSLIIAAQAGHLDIVNMLLAYKGVAVDIQDHQGFSAVHRATWRNHVEVVQALIKKGANLTLKNIDGNTARDLSHSDEMDDLYDRLVVDDDDE